MKRDRKVSVVERYRRDVEAYRTKLLKQVAKLRAGDKKLTYLEIAERLNKEGFRSIQGRPWTLINLYQFVTDRNRRTYRELKAKAQS